MLTTKIYTNSTTTVQTYTTVYNGIQRSDDVIMTSQFLDNDGRSPTPSVADGGQSLLPSRQVVDKMADQSCAGHANGVPKRHGT